ncbi:unnamed protein product, partial [Meganyctiphanes norvegica]
DRRKKNLLFMQTSSMAITDISMILCLTTVLPRSVNAFYIQKSSSLDPITSHGPNIQNDTNNETFPGPPANLLKEDLLLNTLDIFDQLNPSKSFLIDEDSVYDPKYIEESPPVALLTQKENLVDPTPIEKLIFEGDIILTSQDELWYLIGSGNPFVRSALSSKHKLWPNGVIPYTISDEYSDSNRNAIANAMDAFHERTCLRFIPKTDDHDDYVNIFKGSGCSSNVGRKAKGGRQIISLGKGCVGHGTILHELMHTVGFWHEQSRYDRDDYIDIEWDNIDAKRKFNFNKHNNVRTTSLGLAYDYNSLMHYRSHQFAMDSSRPTIIPKDPDAVIGNRKDFSELDLEGLNKLYDCSSKLTTTTSSTTKEPTNKEPTTKEPTTKEPTTKEPTTKEPTTKETTTKEPTTKETTTKEPTTKEPTTKKPTTTKPTTTTTTSAPDPSCKNSFSKCQTWADNGACENYALFMIKYCKHACDACDKASCTDDHASCAEWASQGHCSISPQFMLKYCQRSCDECEE